MLVMYAVHITAGALGLLSGFTALYATKGAPLHRKSGMVFYVVMLTMAAFGLTIAIVRDKAPAINIPAALLTAYLVVTGVTTLRPPFAASRALAIGGAVLAIGVGVVNSTFAVQAIANGGTRNGMPAFPFVMFALVGYIGGISDIRMLQTGPLRGASRVARHLWRMCFALFIAALSFFIGQAKVIPKPIRILPVLALPVLAVLVTMFYWIWRVRVRRSLRGLAVPGAAHAAGD